MPAATEEDFHAAAAALKEAAPPLSQTDLLLIYGMYKQGSEGDCTKPQPSSWNVKAYYKWEAWEKNKGIARSAAWLQYCQEVEKRVPSFALAVAEDKTEEVSQVEAGESGGAGAASGSGSVVTVVRESKTSSEEDDGDLAPLPPPPPPPPPPPRRPPAATTATRRESAEAFVAKLIAGAVVLGVLLNVLSRLGLSWAALEYSLWIYYGRYAASSLASDLIPAVCARGPGEESPLLASAAVQVSFIRRAQARLCLRPSQVCAARDSHGQRRRNSASDERAAPARSIAERAMAAVSRPHRSNNEERRHHRSGQSLQSLRRPTPRQRRQPRRTPAARRWLAQRGRAA